MPLAGAPPLTVTGAGAGADRPLLAAYFGPGAPGLAPADLDARRLGQLASNKLAALPWDREAPPAGRGADGPVTAQIARQQDGQRRWRARLAFAVALFDRLGVRYAAIKALRSPFALMSDVDFLLPWPADIARAARALETAGFALYCFRPIAHPLKLIAKAGPAYSVDLYPDAMWVRKHVLDGAGVVDRAQAGAVRGVAAPLPCSADDLLLVATHAFARGDFTLAELDHGARLIAAAPPAWDHVLAAAAAFGTQDALYAYLRLLVRVADAAGRPAGVPPVVLTALARAPAATAVARWLDRADADLRFRLRIPLLLCTLRSAVYHLPAVRDWLGPRELALDAATHVHTAVTHLLRRD